MASFVPADQKISPAVVAKQAVYVSREVTAGLAIANG